ncbi:DUF262 domain-containing protein [Methylobacterium sp. SD274]|uniref:DUF262 domain-containing protein n=1 Tax=Methylobacterium sp. SD274 TaxID=2782009 RepID=UPI001A97CE34|nr:DUF262 domain-containing protein [Methylobacterium sp. SD274]MBO1022868.1 DUF262 domain-containing protein [Methylobacterium sp. SD274]
MAIREEGVSVVCVGDLIDDKLRIPPYQRPYRWEPSTALQLINDISDAFEDKERSQITYVLGAVILHQNTGDDSPLNVVDGQQRLLTLKMILDILDGADGARYTKITRNPVAMVWNVLSHRVGTWPHDRKKDIRKYIAVKCQLVRVVTNDVDEAFRVFDSQNYRGKPLAPHDLLKAHHLREMRKRKESEPMMAAVVENWEAVSDRDLDRLFSTFLYRIFRWTRGEAAPAFTARDIGMFKGIAAADINAPSARYHLAAQAAVPLLTAWTSGMPQADERNVGRTRFQLDAPVPAGRGFFEMVSFMLGELADLRRGAFNGWEEFASYNPSVRPEDREIFTEKPSRNRYRYVSELYVAALLYFTNKFGDEDLDAARQRLFAWAFTPRVGFLRVQFKTVDKLAQEVDGPSAFSLLRNATSGREVHELPASSKQYNDKLDHEANLSRVLKTLGAQ